VTGVDQLTFRRPVAADIDRAAEVFAAEEMAVRGEVTMGVDELRDWWRLFDLNDGSWLVEDESGAPVGVCCCMHRDRDFDFWIAVRPEYRGIGLSVELLARAEQHARDAGAAALKAGMLAGNERARTLLESRDFREVRRFYRMQIDFDTPPPAGDWGFHAMSFEEWKAHRLEQPHTDTSLWFIAWDGSEAAGVIRCDGTKFGGGFVGALGVQKPWRGRGIGIALLRQAFAEFHRRGAPHVSLGVDAENPTGATRLYERAGMRVVSEDVVFEKDIG
jgi:mycothiol synthase